MMWFNGFKYDLLKMLSTGHYPNLCRASKHFFKECAQASGGAIIPWFGECAYTTLQSTAILCIACLCSARSHYNLIQPSSFFNKKALSEPKSRHYAELHHNSYH